MSIVMTSNYSEDTEGARLCLERSVDLLDRALQWLPDGGAWCFADYGAADGGTTASLYRRVAHVARSRGASLRAVLNDLPANDFDSLARVGQEAFGPDVEVKTVPRSFYESVAEPGSVDLGFSATAMHWLSSPPPPLPHHTHANAAEPTPSAFVDAAQDDWRRLLRLRAEELRPGGAMVLVNLARDARGHYLGWNGEHANMHETLRGLWQQLHREGRFDRDRYERTTFQNYYKSEPEFAAPFAEGSFCGLRMVEVRTESVACPYRRRFDQTGDRAAFASGLMRTVRSWSQHTFRTALADRPDVDAVVADLYQRFEDAIVREPERYSMDYVQNYLLIRKEVTC
jgi:hypothetical protein